MEKDRNLSLVFRLDLGRVLDRSRAATSSLGPYKVVGINLAGRILFRSRLESWHLVGTFECPRQGVVSLSIEEGSGVGG